ncbi:PDC sensor domain-containing protein [Shewanella sp. CAL98-MNA-CIBAN-0140]|uniref:PDC sensor domain-containing protein n=1 Tax=unclassified Shewanella TaxID=196818 RepID=UPI00332A7065
MAAMSYLSVIERYHEYENLVHELLESILIGVGDINLFEQPISAKIFEDMAISYPFVDLIYLLDKKGIQMCPNISVINQQVKLMTCGHHADRSQRPYFTQLAAIDTVHITRPYLSNSGAGLCLSASQMIKSTSGQVVIVVIDVNLTRLIEFMMGDSARRKISPFFKSIYTAIVLCLFVLVSVLMWTVIRDIYTLFSQISATHDPLEPFGIIIFLTLALAIFDLGKTILEEEVLMHKDIFRHSSTRRTITRFISTILIAISIEALLTMFKASLGEQQYIEPAILMMLAVVGLLVGLGIYVYLGAKAELLLTQTQVGKHTRRIQANNE